MERAVEFMVLTLMEEGFHPVPYGNSCLLIYREISHPRPRRGSELVSAAIPNVGRTIGLKKNCRRRGLLGKQAIDYFGT